MTHPEEHLRFGMFMAPFHPAIQNPTRALHRDLELIEHLERLDFDEVWVGEHHSAGAELIASPEVFIAMAAARTSRIRLGTGVVSLPYHHPLWVADRAMLLDHLTQGRFMLGVGPGSLPTDGRMMGLEPSLLRPRLEEGLQAVMALLRSDEPVTMETEWFTLKDAVLQLRPYSTPYIELAVPAVASPTGARLAGKYGISLLTIGAAAAQGVDVFAHHWGIVEEEAAAAGQSVDRASWRVLSIVHLAETEEQARKDVEFGIEEWFRYFQHTAAFPQMAVEGSNIDEMISFVNDNGLGVIGTPEQFVKLLENWQEQSGGFGTCILLHHEFANVEATWRSHGLLSRFVMPHFQGHAASQIRARERAAELRTELSAKSTQAVEAMTAAREEELRARADAAR
jgi:limonene 1,2-monooxygenase